MFPSVLHVDPSEKAFVGIFAVGRTGTHLFMKERLGKASKLLPNILTRGESRERQFHTKKYVKGGNFLLPQAVW